MPPLRLVVPDAAATVERGAEPLAHLAGVLEPLAPFTGLRRGSAHALLRDLAFAVANLATGASARVVLPTEARGLDGSPRGPVLEIGIKRDGSRLLTSVFTRGANPEVLAIDHPSDLDDAMASLLVALDDATASHPGRPDPGLALAHTKLSQARDEQLECCALDVEPLEARGAGRARLVLGATADLRLVGADGERASSRVTRADVHSLLFRGTLHVRAGASDRELPGAVVFLVAEQLLHLVEVGLDAAAASRGMLRRENIAGVLCGLQLDAQGQGTLLLSRPGHRTPWRFPTLPIQEIATAVASFTRALARGLVRADRSQQRNLRVDSFRSATERVRARLRTASRHTSRLNQAPESYRAYAESDTAPPPQVSITPSSRRVGKLRFSHSWTAVVPGIDLRSTFVCGDRLIVGAAREIACIERTTGTMLWSLATRRAASVLTPRGIARLAADGRLAIHGFDDGEPVLELQLAPCVGGSVSGAVVNAPGLPHLLLVGEGSRHLVAIDLDAQEVRWRHAFDQGGRLRLRRAGKLMLVSGAGRDLVALDLLSGEEVWRHGGDERYTIRPVVDRGELFAISGGTRGEERAAIEHFDPWTGKRLWHAPLPEGAHVRGAPLLAADAVIVPLAERGRTGLVAFERGDGAMRFHLPRGLSDGAAACAVVDDLVVGNSDSGELVAVDASSGETRYRHVFANYHGRSDDRPRSVQPVLRSGALFVPQSQVYVVRPGDGALLGRLPSDLIPDLLRVDERCGVYVAELSGHLAAYAALPSLTLVSPA